MKNEIQIKNKRAYFDYHISDTYIAGIALLGTEIKSIRAGKVNLSDSFCGFLDKNLCVRNVHISEYSFSSFYRHDIKRDRVLLLKKKELKKLKSKIDEKGFTLIPLRMFINDRGFCKVEIGVAQGKKDFDKRDTIKERDSKREIDRVMKKF